MNNRTFSIKKGEVRHNWHLVDAKDAVLGRLATSVSSLLIGKGKPEFTSHINVGDKVVIINAEKVKVTGNKRQAKMYYRHSGYPGGLKEENFDTLISRNPEEVIVRAVKGMLPVNKMRNKRLLNLYVYKGSEHPHKAQFKGN